MFRLSAYCSAATYKLSPNRAANFCHRGADSIRSRFASAMFAGSENTLANACASESPGCALRYSSALDSSSLYAVPSLRSAFACDGKVGPNICLACDAFTMACALRSVRLSEPSAVNIRVNARAGSSPGNFLTASSVANSTNSVSVSP
jgi:hypothetical protein